MKLKENKYHFISLLIILLLMNSFFLIESFAFPYSNPSTTPLWSYPTGEQFVSAVDISSDDNYITAITEISNNDQENATLYLFDNSISTTKNPLWTYSSPNDFGSLAISENGSYLAVGGGYQHEIFYLFNNSSPFPEWAHYTGGIVYDVAITNDAHYAAAACGQSNMAFLINSTKSPSIKRFKTDGLALEVEISSDGNYMAVTDNTGKLYFFNTSKTTPEWEFNLTSLISGGLSMSEDGNYIVIGDDNVYVFNKNSSFPIRNYNTSGYIESIKISEDGNYIVAAGSWNDKKVYLFNRSSPTPEWIFTTKGEVFSIAISSSGDYIVAHSFNEFIYLFNKSSSIPIWRYKLDGFTYSDSSLAISSDGKYIVAGGRHRVYLFDRDIINPPKLVIPGYNQIFLFFIFTFMVLISLLIIYHSYKKIQK